MDINFPVLVLAKDSGEVLKFDSLQDMQSYMEPIDVENAEYDAWDRLGRPIALRVQQPAWLCVDLVSQERDNLALSSTFQKYAISRGFLQPVQISNESDLLDLYDRISQSPPRKHSRRCLLAKIVNRRQD